MILRRVIRHVRNQEWTASGIDFVIVVVGVFVGLQVSNWNEAQADRSREATYLQGIGEDLRSDIVEIDEIIHVSESRMSALGVLLDKATGWRPPTGFASSRGQIEIEEAEPFDGSGPYTIGIELFILSTLDGNRFAYETLINSDGIGVLQDKVLVRQIQDYYALVDKAIHFEVSLEENRLRLIDAQQRAGISPVDEHAVDELARLFSEQPPLIAAAKNYWLYANRHLKLMRGLRGDAETLADEIEQKGSK